MARLVSFYGSTPAYLPVLEIEGWADVHPELNALSKRGDFAAMRDDHRRDGRPDRGRRYPSQVAAEIGARFSAHSDEVCCYFPGYDPGPALTRQLVDCLHGSARRRPPRLRGVRMDMSQYEGSVHRLCGPHDARRHRRGR